MNLPEVVSLLILLCIAPLIVYQLMLSLMATTTRLNTRFPSDSARSFAVVVPAHNEAKMISKTLYSLSALIYPRTNYDIYVIADNCTDSTAAQAHALGVHVLVRTDDTLKGKGYALRWAFDQLTVHEKAYDAIVVVDADTLISGNFLEVMNFYLETGSRVIQSSDLVLPRSGNWSIEATRMGFLLQNYIKPLGRKKLHLSMGLRGNGMCFQTNVLRDVPWEAWSLTEDLEYGLNLLLNDIPIDFAPEATVYAQMPVEAKNAESQRSRWEMGRLQVVREYAGAFLKKAVRQRSLSSMDVFIDLITPPFVNLMLVTAGMLTLITGLWLVSLVSLLHLLLWGALFTIGFVYLGIGICVAGGDRSVYKSLLYVPMYSLWKLKVYAKALKKGKEVEWIRTERDS